MSSPFSTGNMGVAPTQEGVPLRHLGGSRVSCVGTVLVCRFRGVRSCVGAVLVCRFRG